MQVKDGTQTSEPQTPTLGGRGERITALANVATSFPKQLRAECREEDNFTSCSHDA